MKMLLSLTVLFLGQLAMAASLNCDVSESKDSQNTKYVLNLPLNGASHGGDILQVKAKTLPRISFMLAYVKGIAIIQINDSVGQTFTSSRSDMTGSGYASAQHIMSTDVHPRYLDSVNIDCVLVK